MCLVFFFKQKTAYEMRISDWSSDVCSSDLLSCGCQRRDCILARQCSCLHAGSGRRQRGGSPHDKRASRLGEGPYRARSLLTGGHCLPLDHGPSDPLSTRLGLVHEPPSCRRRQASRSEEHTSELQSLMRISYAVFCLKKKNNI